MQQIRGHEAPILSASRSGPQSKKARIEFSSWFRLSLRSTPLYGLLLGPLGSWKRCLGMGIISVCLYCVISLLSRSPQGCDMEIGEGI